MSSTDMTQSFTLTRTLDATPEQVWHAWTDPDAIADWWHPRNTSTPRDEVEVDVRVGGHYTYTMVNDDTGERVVTGGVYQEVSPVERLVFTWGEPGSDPEDTPIVTVTLEPSGGGTHMTFELHGFAGQPGDGFVYDGWDEALDVLEEYLA
ncbi:MAG: SRPBCC domain-containing protein [Yaniella sp.]|uniref:SRPBCC family protein n=2 Tax=Yaniella sp. TaxID=2773929 RepID=UPI00264A280F|nr:SRPBCC domain-containing protein [Yaniella sp.]MDN5732610.1 SRPBCC domain-containing protein [Yaniella sp.]MDN5838953.1 SRPBCC domain-containing protein [Yaniella sp.]MDN6150854.1 SRPBCC domain-containing protein [Yaniella sp.]MDN6758262.1 SRPBCC domain-containing protein [Yaniella sp.]